MTLMSLRFNEPDVVKSLECPVISVNINSRFLMLFTALYNKTSFSSHLVARHVTLGRAYGPARRGAARRARARVWFTVLVLPAS
jgi:hypothetical protein